MMSDSKVCSINKESKAHSFRLFRGEKASAKTFTINESSAELISIIFKAAESEK